MASASPSPAKLSLHPSPRKRSTGAKMATEERHPCLDDGVESELPTQEAVSGDVQVEEEEEEEQDDSSEDFEFSFAVSNPVDLRIVTADELFSGGRILPAYPVVSRFEDPAELRVQLGRLSIDDAGSSRPRARDEERGTAFGEPPPVSAPRSPERRCEKSASTGSTGRARRWTLRDLVARSRSDGKEKFSFIVEVPDGKSPTLPPAGKKVKVSAGERGADKAKGEAAAAAGQRMKEMDMVAAHRLYYGAGKGSSERGTTRRSFLPYRRELVGLFAPVNRLSW